jgi:hypothetical protein
MNRQDSAALSTFLLLVPAAVLVASGLLGRVPPPGLTHPALVLGGLVLAVGWSLARVVRLRFARMRETLVLTMLVETHGRAMSLAVLAIGSLLLAVIAAYLFLENVHPLAA